MDIHLQRIADFAEKSRLPAIYPELGWVDAGGFISYGPSLPDLSRRLAFYVHEVLHGFQPGELPVQQATHFELGINLKAAKQIGLAIPPNVLARADRVIR
jgi:putative ABC transport system substrate-binding protein